VTVAAVIAAAGTFAVAAFALVQIKDERSARQHNESELREKEATQQAERIAAWPAAADSSGLPTSRGPEGRQVTYVDLNNGSSEPVYDVVVSLVFVQGAGPRTGKEVARERLETRQYPANTQRTLMDIPPGRSRIWLNGEWPGMMKRPGIEIAFIDASNRAWIRYSNGALEPISKSPLQYYGLPEPQELATPEPAH
jgi:hypothetical protein